jgi:predicted transposase/invertase (TIGR01784 family)
MQRKSCILKVILRNASNLNKILKISATPICYYIIRAPSGQFPALAARTAFLPRFSRTNLQTERIFMNKRNTIKNEFKGKDYLNASGRIPYGMMNDYIFRIVFQENKFALKGLLCAILGLPEDKLVGLTITNEVKPGISISSKEYRLDIVIELDDGTTIDLEMQKEDYNNWQYRSLVYLCREFDSLDHGDDYNDVKPAYQVGFIDFSLFDDHPEFFATYQMRNSHDNHLYTDRFNLIVISLNQIELATDEDKAHGIDRWARLFKSKTWEELIMVANDDKYMTSAIESVFLTNADKNAIKIAREREDFLRAEAYKKNQLQKLSKENKDLSKKNKDLTKVVTDQAATIAQLQAEIASLKSQQ